MPTKTDRILGYLPGTFRPLPGRSTLRAVVDALGSELQKAENSLAAVMQSHWVDHADRGAEEIDDLACIAALYGVAPRADEGIEEFRARLKRHVRTFLEGAVTVQGILRTAADALGISIDDDYDHMDSWWTRESDEMVTVQPRGDDAASYVLGSGSAISQGRAAAPASITGSVDLSRPVDLRGASILGISIDGAADGGIAVDLTEGAGDPSAVRLEEIRDAINGKIGAAVATDDGRRLTLASMTRGPTSRLDLIDLPGDASERVLGLPPMVYRGRDESPAEVTGAQDLSGGVDLSDERYVRIVIDAVRTAEVDCAGGDPENTSIDEIRDAINATLGTAVASHDGSYLRLQSPTRGSQSSISLERPASQDATLRIFGPVMPFYVGSDALPAAVIGRKDIRRGADLREGSVIRLRVGGVAYNIDCIGADAARTMPSEIVDAVNAATGSSIASHDGSFITLTSPSAGSSAEIAFETLPGGSAQEEIFGIPPRSFTGADSTGAVIRGVEIPPRLDLRARHLLSLSVDGRGAALVDLAARASDPGAATPGEVVDAINEAVGEEVAGDEGSRLIIRSGTKGAGSRLEVHPLESICRRRFVTRAPVTDEAAMRALGFVRGEARGEPAAAARIVGIPDLRGGVDLTGGQYLRISVDGSPGVDVNCGVPRARAALIDEIVKAVNDALGAAVASHDGRHLILASPTAGAGSRIALEPPRGGDALDPLLGVPPGDYRGGDATGVVFTGTVDLSQGITLDPGASLKVGIDGGEPVEIVIGGGQLSLDDIVTALDARLGPGVAGHDVGRITLESQITGAGSVISFDEPSGPDATDAVLGIKPPRLYRGRDRTKAVVAGSRDLSGGIKLDREYILRISIDGSPYRDIDSAPRSPGKDLLTIDEVVGAVNAALGSGVASHDGKHLILSSSVGGSIALDHHTSGDARDALLGEVGEARGRDASPATLTGEIVPEGPLDLSERRAMRLSIDGAQNDIDVAGDDPGRTFIDEVASELNAAYGLKIADISEDGKLRITSPSTGVESRVCVLPLRYLEVVEYPPIGARWPAEGPASLSHGEGWSVNNRGASDVSAGIGLAAPGGASGPSFVNETFGLQVRLLEALAPGDRALIRRDGRGIRAQVVSPDGTARTLPGDGIIAGPIGYQTIVPFEGERHLSGRDGEPPEIGLNNPPSPMITRLRARGSTASDLKVKATGSDLSALDPGIYGPGVTGRVVRAPDGFDLVDATGGTIAHLRSGEDLATLSGRTVLVSGEVHETDVIFAQTVDEIFDLTLRSGQREEVYRGVTIGAGGGPASLLARVNAVSRLALVLEEEKGAVLALPRGRSLWRYMDCHAARFDMVNFDEGRFAGGFCADRAVFDVSRFAGIPGEKVCAVFASWDDGVDVQVSLVWDNHTPGAFTVNLPADLPERFGGAFNRMRLGGSVPETYPGAVVDPVGDPMYLATVLKGSNLVRAERAARVPLGWEAVPLPFNDPVGLKGGGEGSPSKIYLTEEGIDDFIEIRAVRGGGWGDGIKITARRGGPAMYDLSVIYEGGRFENARATVLGTGPGIETIPCRKGGAGGVPPVAGGILKAKAAGVRADVARERTYPDSCIRGDAGRDGTDGLLSEDVFRFIQT